MVLKFVLFVFVFLFLLYLQFQVCVIFLQVFSVTCFCVCEFFGCFYFFLISFCHSVSQLSNCLFLLLSVFLFSVISLFPEITSWSLAGCTINNNTCYIETHDYKINWFHANTKSHTDGRGAARRGAGPAVGAFGVQCLV